MIGSIAGILTYVFLPESEANSILAMGLGLGFAIVVSQYAEQALQSHDDSRIVIDEWIGAWIACWGLGQSAVLPLILALLFFRIFDVFKGPWGHALQKLPGGFGVTLDDVVAGILANIFTRISLLFL